MSDAPAVVQPRPAEAQPHPAEAQPLPAAVQALPAAVQALPAVVQALPAVVQALPAAVQALPAVEQALPAVAQPLPAVVQALPAVVQAVPADVQAKPASLAGVLSARGDAAMRFTACAALLAGALVALAGQASAQESTYVEKKTSDGQDVRFRDDPIGALTRDPIGSQLSGFHPPKRFDLMRPRKTWIPEMLKSIENM